MPDIQNPVGNGTFVWKGNRDPILNDASDSYIAAACRTANSCLELFTPPTPEVDLPMSLERSELKEMFINVNGGDAELEFPNELK